MTVGGFNEANAVQEPILRLLEQHGWQHIPGRSLPGRSEDSAFIEDHIRQALIALNPEVAKAPERAEEILSLLRDASLTWVDDGLVKANQKFTEWLRGFHTHQFIGDHHYTPVRLIDFDNPSNNTYVASSETRYGTPGAIARFDIVLWVNGFPLAVGELKTPVRRSITWVKGATEITDVYEVNHAGFFVPNVFSFATDGHHYAYAGVATPVDKWKTWGSTDDPATLAGWDRVKRCVTTMLTPRVVLDLLHSFTVFETSQDDAGVARLKKIVARYPQYEAVIRLVDRVREKGRSGGLIHHTQGSGKTLAMVFAAAILAADRSLDNPTIIMVADRVQLVTQTYDQFRTTSMPRLSAPSTADQLRALLRKDQRGLVFTTIHKFAGSQELNRNGNVIVLVDEAHRTQEGTLGADMRRALPNARFFGFTGTPIADDNHNTFALFGDPDDPKSTLHVYDSDRSIADGMTVPIHVAPRLVDFQIDKENLDEAFEQLVLDEELEDDQREFLRRKVTSVETFFSNPDRVRAVVADMLDHFYATIDPLGLKAQVVALNRPLCVAYEAELNRQLAERGFTDEAAVVMHVAPKDPPEWQAYALTPVQEEDLLGRFRTFGDPLKFLIVTSKLGTGFDAPIEGVMYLDKPLKTHTLYQTITRTNRNWRNPETGQEKNYGLIVDYVGLGDGFARAMAPADPDTAAPKVDMSDLLTHFVDLIAKVMFRFRGIDYAHITSDTFEQVHEVLRDPDDQEAFAIEFEMLQRIYEAVAPHDTLRKYAPEYTFLAKTYESVIPRQDVSELVWHRLGAKTMALVHAHISDVRVARKGGEVVIADAETIKTLIDAGFIDPDTVGPAGDEGEVTVAEFDPDEFIDTIAERLKRRHAHANDEDEERVFASLAERLEKLRQKTLDQAVKSAEYLQSLFDLATDVTAAEKAADEGTLSLLPDRRVGALTQIFREYAPADTPAIVGKVVEDVDTIVREVSYEGWSATQHGDSLVRRELRKILKRHGFPVVGDLFDKAYAYIRENY